MAILNGQKSPILHDCVLDMAVSATNVGALDDSEDEDADGNDADDIQVEEF